MSLKDQLMDDFKTAMRDKNVVKKNAVQFVRASILQLEKDTKTTLDDAGVVDVIAREVKKRRDVLPEYEKSGRQDSIDTIKQEIEILLGYLPEQLNEAELKIIVKECIDECGASSMKEMGKVMQLIMPRVKGRADGKIVNQILKDYFS